MISSNDLLKKIDGHTSPLKQPDEDDWITNCDAQGQVHPEIRYFVEELKVLQGS